MANGEVRDGPDGLEAQQETPVITRETYNDLPVDLRMKAAAEILEKDQQNESSPRHRPGSLRDQGVEVEIPENDKSKVMTKAVVAFDGYHEDPTFFDPGAIALVVWRGVRIVPGKVVIKPFNLSKPPLDSVYAQAFYRYRTSDYPLDNPEADFAVRAVDAAANKLLKTSGLIKRLGNTATDESL